MQHQAAPRAAAPARSYRDVVPAQRRCEGMLDSKQMNEAPPLTPNKMSEFFKSWHCLLLFKLEQKYNYLLKYWNSRVFCLIFALNF